MSKTLFKIHEATKYIFLVSYILGVTPQIAFSSNNELCKIILKILHVFNFLVTLVLIVVNIYYIPEQKHKYNTALHNSVEVILSLNYFLLDIFIIIYRLKFSSEYKQICIKINTLFNLLQRHNIEINWKLVRSFSVYYLIFIYGLAFIYIIFEFYTYGILDTFQFFYMQNILSATAINCQISILMQCIKIFSNLLNDPMVETLKEDRNCIRTFMKVHLVVFDLSRHVNKMFNAYFLVQIVAVFYSVIYTVFYLVVDSLETEHDYIWLADCCTWIIPYLFPVTLVVLLSEQVQRQVCFNAFLKYSLITCRQNLSTRIKPVAQ